MNRNRRNQRRATFGRRTTTLFIVPDLTGWIEAVNRAAKSFASHTAANYAARLSADVQRGTPDHHTEDQ